MGTVCHMDILCWWVVAALFLASANLGCVIVGSARPEIRHAPFGKHGRIPSRDESDSIPPCAIGASGHHCLSRTMASHSEIPDCFGFATTSAMHIFVRPSARFCAKKLPQ